MKTILLKKRKSASPANSDGFTEAQIERYSRNIILPEIGGRGQKRLMESSALIVGAGGLGSPAAMYLAAAGVGRLGLADDERVDLSNLQRQILHSTKDVGRLKVASAREKLCALNPEVEVEAHSQRLTSQNALKVLSEYDVILDGSDNFPTRYLVNDACVILKKPLVSGAIFRFEGQVMTILPKRGPCYRCLFPDPPPAGTVPSCQQAGILGVVAGIVGSIQAAEALKILLGKGDSLAGRILLLSGLEMSFREVSVKRSVNCPVCGDTPSITRLIDYEAFCGEDR